MTNIALSEFIDTNLTELIHRCLSFSALKRPEGMAAVRDALDTLADEATAKLADPDEIER